MSYFLLLIHLHSILCLTVSSSSPFNYTKAHTKAPIAKPNCVDDCGGVRIPYPFGIGPDCFHDPFYEIFCNLSFKPLPKPFLNHYHLEVTDIQYPGREGGTYYLSGDLDRNLLTVRAPPTNVCERDGALLLGVDFRGSPYRFSNPLNGLLVEGCSGNVVIRDKRRQIVSGCTSLCAKSDATINLTTCHGVQCCQSSLLPPSINIYMNGHYIEFEDTRRDCWEKAGIIIIAEAVALFLSLRN